MSTIDAEARRQIAEHLDATLFVEAAAGTGKTTALVCRIVALLRSGRATLDRVVALTFADKAAGEMRLRLRKELETARSDTAPGSDERRWLDAALEHLELARIATIHAFCGDLLQERPVEAGVDPLFAIAAPEEAARLLERAFDDWFQNELADPPEGMRRLLRRRPRGPDARSARATLFDAARSLVEHRDYTALWRRDPFDRVRAIDAVMVELEVLAALSPSALYPDDWLAKNFANVARFMNENRLREAVRGRDHDALEAELRQLLRKDTGWHYKGANRKEFAPGVSRADAMAKRDAAKQHLDRLVADCDADLAACLQPELMPVVKRYEEHKRAAGVLDFVDLLVCTRELLVRDAAVRADLARRFTHYFVDEFQDTDPLQAEILMLLVADDPEQSDWRAAVPKPGRLFLVGDPKQSIYRFRRADVSIYEQIKERLREHGAEVVLLRASFRSVPAIQAAVNAAFEPEMQAAADRSQASYVALEPVREDAPRQPAVVVVPAPRPYGDYGTVVSWKVEESLPDAVGAFVDWLIGKSGWTVEERGERVPLAARHVCLLFRRFKHFRDDATRPYQRALEARRIPHVLVGGRSFHDREEVIALRNALTAIEWPGDEFSVYAALRGPFFALTDDVLLAWRAAIGTIHPVAPRTELPAGEPELHAVAEALDVLSYLHRGRNRRSIADTVGQLLEAVRAHAALAIWPTGEQALANCLRVMDLARRFERTGAPSFRAFVDRLEEDAEGGETEDAPVVEEGTEGVRIMTAHRAKGLEFPVVVLCDPTAKATREQPSRHVDPERSLWAEPLAGCAPRELLEASAVELARDRAEAVRLAYVAATRARDLLVVTAVADAELEDTWLSALHPAIYPTPRSPGEGEPAPGCPAFRGAAVCERPNNARPDKRAPVNAGRLTPRTGRHSVVWWDPKVLVLDAKERVGLRQQRILEADESGAADEGERLHAQWRAEREALLAAGARASCAVASVTALAEERAREAAPEVRIETVVGRGARPHGRRFGSLVHAVLAEVDLRAAAAEVARTVELQGRIVGASAEEVAAARDVVAAALSHPVIARAAASPTLRREVPVSLVQGDGRLAEGVVDLAFREANASWTVVDFKTDAELGARRATYAVQVQLYADAIARATGEPAEPLLLVV